MKLSEKHIRILELYTGDAVMATREELAAIAGVSRATVQRVLREPEAKRIIEELRTERNALAQPAVDATLLNLALKGDVQAIRTFKQMTGEIGSGGPTVITNVTQNNKAEDFIERLWADRRLAEATEGQE